MKSKLSKVVGLLAVLTLMMALGACAKKTVPGQAGFGAGAGAGGTGSLGGGVGGLGMDDAKWRELGINSEAEKREFLDKAAAFENQDVYFDYDGYALSEPAKKIIDSKVEFLRRYSKVRVVIEGNTDERGTNEYNMALGERRANAALQYMSNSGLTQANISIVSYGEEKPAAPGHDESAWAKNRRAHFVLNY